MINLYHYILFIITSIYQRSTTLQTIIKPYWTSLSIGATEVTPHMSLSSALENADKSLYQTKGIVRGSFSAHTLELSPR